MAGVFGDDIDDRDGFLRALKRTQKQIAELPGEYKKEPVIRAVTKQLDAIEAWTRDGATPVRKDRESIVMGHQFWREYENTSDKLLLRLQEPLTELSNYMRYWPSNEIAASQDNFQYVLNYYSGEEEDDE